MSELTDDQLDGLFRKSAEEFDPPFDPAAWRDMKTRLDANDRNPVGGTPIWKNLLRWGLPIALLFLLSGGGWYAYRRINSVAVKSNSLEVAKTNLSRKAKQAQLTTATPTSDNEPIRTSTADPKVSPSEAEKQPTDLVASVAEPARPENRSDKSVTRLEKTVVSDRKTVTERSASAYKLKVERTRSNRSQLIRSEDLIRKDVAGRANYERGKTTLRISKSAQRRRKIADSQSGRSFAATNDALVSASRLGKPPMTNRRKLTQVSVTDAAGNVTPLTASETGQSATLPTVSELTIRPAQWPKPMAFVNREVAVQPDRAERSVVPKVASQRGLSVRLVVAPDLSAVGLKNFSRPGTNVGALLEYRLAPRWSVQAGVIQSTKVYRALPNEYTEPEGTWNGYPKLENVDGRCNMLDIPLNLRYDVFLQPRKDGRSVNHWFVSGGVTSYIMKQEKYVYNYKPHNNYGQPTDTTTSTGGYGFSTLNLSIGYERALSKRLSWQIEPFLKAPLRGVGYFKVNLLSTGAFFSIRYKL